VVASAAMLAATSSLFAYSNTSGIERAPEYGFGDQTISILDGDKANLYGSGRAFTLGYSAGVGHSDNVDYSASAPESGRYIYFAPYAGISKVIRDHQFWFNVQSRVASFDTGNDDAYTDFAAQAAAMFNSNGRHRFEVDTRYLRGHHQNNVQRARNAGITDEDLDRYAEPSVTVRYILGHPSARLRFAVLGTAADREYRNNRYATEFYDHQRTGLGLQGFYQLASKTTLIGGVGVLETEFDTIETGFESRDSETTKVYAGLRWLATAKTAGEIRIGFRNTDFDSGDYSDEDRLYWNVLVDWRPRLRDKISLSTSRSQEVSRFSDFADVERTQYTVRWIHNWQDRYQTNLGVDYLDVVYTGDAATGSRTDDLIRYVAGVKAKIGEKSTIGLGYVHSERDSDSPAFDYDADTIELTLEAHL
jgi:hypothetical protein